MDFSKVKGHFSVDKYHFIAFPANAEFTRIWDIQCWETDTDYTVRVTISVATTKLTPSANISASLKFSIEDKVPDLSTADKLEMIRDVIARTDQLLQEHLLSDAGDMLPFDFPSDEEILKSVVTGDKNLLN